ncbi:hypothetical protein [Aureimonas pseudogalii]|uniref:Uncharacterized protein n=1 Tax=Aureimonas pseudogalii TaxID=1744844 RepID=A0A7W6H4B3_9HYPH|nr:hypothetical protein [Aureimonas pseudogalii]MBB3997938.1 hypothetical protein [Aureimonas pseudogalii]
MAQRDLGFVIGDRRLQLAAERRHFAPLQSTDPSNLDAGTPTTAQPTTGSVAETFAAVYAPQFATAAQVWVHPVIVKAWRVERIPTPDGFVTPCSQRNRLVRLPVSIVQEF